MDQDEDRIVRRRSLKDLSAAEQRQLIKAFHGHDAEEARVLAKKFQIDLAEAWVELRRAEEDLERFAAVAKAVTRVVKQTEERFRKSHENESVLATPPRLVGARLLSRLLRPADYKRLIEPHIADMHEEYFACLIRQDERGARWAIVRGNLYAVPSWLWGLLAQLLARVIDWMRT